jgi:chemotaxis protein methyltransferase CheR
VELQIVATDVDPVLLERARRAIYPASAVEQLPARWRSSAFERLDAGYSLREEFRSGVEFQRQDIRDAMPAGHFDLILCRNVAFTYFEIDVQHAILAGLVDRLAPGGPLLVGAHERLPEPSAVIPSAETTGLYRRPAQGGEARSATFET